MTREELEAALELPIDPYLHGRELVWPVVNRMAALGFRFILSRSHHRPKVACRVCRGKGTVPGGCSHFDDRMICIYCEGEGKTCLPTWRASFCRWGGKSNRWFCGHPGEAVVKSAMIAQYNREHPEDRYVQRLPTKPGHYEE